MAMKFQRGFGDQSHKAITRIDRIKAWSDVQSEILNRIQNQNDEPEDLNTTLTHGLQVSASEVQISIPINATISRKTGEFKVLKKYNYCFFFSKMKFKCGFSQ